MSTKIKQKSKDDKRADALRENLKKRKALKKEQSLKPQTKEDRNHEKP